MDGVILDTERLILEMYIKGARILDFEFPEDEFIKTIGLDKEGTKEIFAGHIPVPFDDLYEMKENLLKGHIHSFGPPIKPGVTKGLKKIKKAGLKTALATSTSGDRALFRLQKSMLLDLFDEFAFGNEIERGKPAPDIFLLAAERLGASPGECVVLEDSPAGVMSAKAAGMHVVLIPDMKQPDNEMLKFTDFVAKDFSAASDYVLS
jgi:HAD superfamily hydrolase (TIGR01509 family)